MKKTVIVNINGIIFHIDEDAYGKLNTYLDALHRYFDSQTEGKEIVSDIESRIAELLQPLIYDTKQSVTIEDIESIIATLGKPEDIAGDDNQVDEPKEQKQAPSSSHRFNRRLYRDPDNTIIGGVCSGIAAYFDIDPVLIRIIFIALFFAAGASIIIYPILWIAVPLAQTAAQKLEMRGEDVTINNIERTYHSPEQTDPNSVWGRLRSFINSIFGLIGKIFFALWKVISFAIGAFLVLFAITIMISIIAATFFNKFYIDEIASGSAISVKGLLSMVINPADINILLIVLLLVVLIPLIALIYAGLKLIIRFKVNDRWALLSVFLLWIVCVITGSILIFSQFNNFKAQGNVKEFITLSAPKGNIIYLSTSFSPGNEELSKFNFPPEGLFGIKTKDNQTKLWGISRIDIEQSSKTYPELEIIREARSSSFEDATEAAKQIKVNVTHTDSALSIEPIFWVNQDKWKFQRAKVILHLPVGLKVYIDQTMAQSLNYAQNMDEYWSQKMTGKTWQMTENGLELLRNSTTETFELKNQANHVLYLQKRDRYSVSEEKINDHRFGHLTYEGKTFNFKSININIKKSKNNSAKIEVEKRTSWTNNSNNQFIGQTITYSFEQKDSVLWLDPIFLFPENMKQNDQEVNLNIYLPIDSKVNFSHDMKPLLKKYAEKHHMSEYDFVNKSWKMTFDGLHEIEEKKEAND